MPALPFRAMQTKKMAHLVGCAMMQRNYLLRINIGDRFNFHTAAYYQNQLAVFFLKLPDQNKAI